MPCTGPTPEEERLYKKRTKEKEEEENRCKIDPEFAQYVKERDRKEGERAKKASEEWDRHMEEADRQFRKRFENKVKGERSTNKLLNLSFGSFMTVFLCKAMEIIENNDLMGLTYEAMEWWYKTHKSSDRSGRLPKNTEDTAHMLLWINDRYKVIEDNREEERVPFPKNIKI